MTQYRKKPVIIEAVQFDGLNPTEIKDFVGKNCEVEIYDNGVTPPVAHIVIHTLEGDMEVSNGDYVIKGVKGEFYPCKPDIFQQTYESEELDKKVTEALKNRGNSPKSNTNSQKGIVYQAINEIMGGHTPEKLAECNQTIFKVAMRALEIQQEEHLLPKGVDEAAEKYGEENQVEYWSKAYNLHTSKQDLIDSFKAGAEWQKGQDQETIELTEEHAMLAGRMQMKEEMMKEAVEGYVNYYEASGGILMAEAQVGYPYHNGDKVKFIIVKED